MPNKKAIEMLERAVSLDSTYAPAWDALGQRYYYLGSYSDGGEAALLRSDKAYERALSLDPNLIFASASLLLQMAERGDVANAYARALDIVKRHPEKAIAHFGLAYVLRYAGMLDESKHECDLALMLDSGNYRFRSCAWTFLESGDTRRAADFINLDKGSEWAAYVFVSSLLRDGKVEQARMAIQRVSTNPYDHRDFLEACVQSEPPENLNSIAQKVEAAVLAEPDPETRYYEGAVFAFCRKPEEAIRLIRSAIDQNYCSLSALQRDPLLASLRGRSEFGNLLTAARECQKKFLAIRDQFTN